MNRLSCRHYYINIQPYPSKRQLSRMKYKTIVDLYMTWWFKHCSSLLSNYSVIKLYFVTMILGESKRRQVLLDTHRVLKHIWLNVCIYVRRLYSLVYKQMNLWHVQLFIILVHIQQLTCIYMEYIISCRLLERIVLWKW